MNSGNDARHEGESPNPIDSDDAIPLPDRQLIDRGQITIPSGVRERYGIEPGDVLDLYASGEDGWTERVPKVEVTAGKTVRFPAYLRDYYGLEDGDWLEVTLVPVDG